MPLIGFLLYGVYYVQEVRKNNLCCCTFRGVRIRRSRPQIRPDKSLMLRRDDALALITSLVVRGFSIDTNFCYHSSPSIFPASFPILAACEFSLSSETKPRLTGGVFDSAVETGRRKRVEATIVTFDRRCFVSTKSRKGILTPKDPMVNDFYYTGKFLY